MEVSPPLGLVGNPHVAVAAADPVVRRALGAMVRDAVEGAEVSAHASLDVAALEDVDVVLWDLGADEAAATERLATHARPTCPVVSLLPTSQLAPSALAWGARAVLSRDADEAALGAALQAVARGLVVLAPAFVEALAAAAPELPRAVADDVTLTAREREVLQHIAEGLSNKLVAVKLGISEHTVKFHVNAVMERLGAQTRTDAVVRAARRGLLVL